MSERHPSYQVVCDSWAEAVHLRGKLRDRLRCGHSRHVCVEKRQPGALHLGRDHRCRCGFRWRISENELTGVKEAAVWHSELSSTAVPIHKERRNRA